MVDVDAIDRLMEAGQGQLIHCPQEPDHVYILRDPKHGLFEHKIAMVKPRCHEMRGFDDFVKLVNQIGGDNTRVFCAFPKVIALLDESYTRRDRVTMTLTKTHPFQCIERLGHEINRFTQQGLIDFLKVDLNMCVAPDVVTSIRQLKFKSGSETESSVDHKKESLGRSTLAEVYGNAPEEIVARLPVFEEFTENDYTVGLSLGVRVHDPQTPFELRPYPGEINRVLTVCEASIAKMLGEKITVGAGVFCGVPSLG